MTSSTYLATEAGQFLYQAHRFLSAARILRFSDTWETDARLIQTPTLHLVAHGAELLLKLRLLEQGQSQSDIAKKFGHNLAKLWAADANVEMRHLILECAETAWRIARDSGRYQDDFSGDSSCMLVGALDKLTALHGRETNFALRYTLSADTTAPRPAFLIDAFGDAAEQLFPNGGERNG